VSPRILVAASPGEVRVAVADGDDLLDYAIWRPGRPDGVGDLHRGRITAIVPAMAGAFVALDGSGGEEGFLPDSEGAAGLAEGAMLAVRVSRGPAGGKGARLTARLSPAEQEMAGAGKARLVRRGPGAVERLAAHYGDAPIVTDDDALAAALRPALGARLSVRAPAWSEPIADAVAALATPEAALPHGARMTVSPTPALTAIDIDAGAATAARDGKPRAQAALNRAILPAVARQIRLRNLGGAIVVDLAGLSIRKRAALAPDFVAALAGDPLAPRFLGFSALGLAEILRPRIHPPLHELLAGPHAAGLAGLCALAAHSAADPATRLALRTAPPVVAALQQDGAALADFIRRCGRPPVLRADPGLPGTAWQVENAGRDG